MHNITSLILTLPNSKQAYNKLQLYLAVYDCSDLLITESILNSIHL